MSIDKEKLMALAQAATQNHGPRRVEVDHNGVHVIGDGSGKILSAWHTSDGKGLQNAEFAAAASPATVLALLAEIDELAFEPAKHSRRLIDQLKAENEALRMQVKELDLTFGRYLLGMRASVIEWQEGKGADDAMLWIWNGLRGPGELPPEGETQAQAYFDREVVKIDEGLEEVYAYRDKRRAENAKEKSK
jgi:hypothetical protein